MTQQTAFEKMWAAHKVCDAGDGYDLLAIDRLLLHERTGGVALKSLQENDYAVRDPSRVFCIMDHVVSFDPERGRDESRMPGGDVFIKETREMALKAGLRLIDTDDDNQGIVHVVAPELGIAGPGLSLLCPDSHTCSLGALGAMAWGIGSSEAEHVLATGVLRAKLPKRMRVRITGAMMPGVTAKDLALALIAKYGAQGGQRHAIEFSGPVIDAMSIEERLTLCNMAVEFAAHSAFIAPDEKTIAYLRHRPFAAPDDALRAQCAMYQSDADATFDTELSLNASQVTSFVSWGTSPEDSAPLEASVPDDAGSKALAYMGLSTGESLNGLEIGGAFIGSCTNGRLSDLQAAAQVLEGRRVAPHVDAICVPGSQSVKRAAEAAGIDVIFKQAGFLWGAPGCAMCFYAGGKTFAPGTRVVSSTNRNFEGRQGPGVRTHLASPATVAASAVAGYLCAPADLPMPSRETENV